MIIKIKIDKEKKTKKNKIVVLIQDKKELRANLQELFLFYKENVTTKTLRNYCKYYKVSSENPAIMMSLISTLFEIIPDFYFNVEEPSDLEDQIDVLSIKKL